MGEAVQEMESPEGREKEAGREELSQLVNALRDAVMDLRETVSELGNPLAKLEPNPQVGRREEVSEGGKSEGDSGGGTNQRAGMPPGGDSGEDSGMEKKEIGKHPSYILPSAPSLKEMSKLRTAGIKPHSRLAIRKVLSFLRLLFELKDSMDPLIMGRYITIYKGLGLISSEEADILGELANLVVEGSKYGLKAEDHIALMVLLAKTLGINDRELEREGLKLLISMARRRINSLGRHHNSVSEKGT